MSKESSFQTLATASLLQLLPALLLLIANSSHGLAEAPDEPACPDGYRLHYQGFCINIEDELSDRLGSEVLGADPIPTFSSDSTGYKFSNMTDGEFCKDAYIKLSRGLIAKPAAMALGDQSCGLSSVASKSTNTARLEALRNCRAATGNCRIIFPEGLQ